MQECEEEDAEDYRCEKEPGKGASGVGGDSNQEAKRERDQKERAAQWKKKREERVRASQLRRERKDRARAAQ